VRFVLGANNSRKGRGETKPLLEISPLIGAEVPKRLPKISTIDKRRITRRAQEASGCVARGKLNNGFKHWGGCEVAVSCPPPRNRNRVCHKTLCQGKVGRAGDGGVKAGARAPQRRGKRFSRGGVQHHSLNPFEVENWEDRTAVACQDTNGRSSRLAEMGKETSSWGIRASKGGKQPRAPPLDRGRAYAPSRSH